MSTSVRAQSMVSDTEGGFFSSRDRTSSTAAHDLFGQCRFDAGHLGQHDLARLALGRWVIEVQEQASDA